MLTASACAYSGETIVTSGQQTGNSESGEQETRGRESAEAETGEAVMPETETPPCAPNNSLYELETVVSGEEFIERLSGTITVFPYEE